MYLFLENNIIIPHKNIILIIDYIHIKNQENISFFKEESKSKKVINLAPKAEKSVVFTEENIYITSYGTQTLLSRSNEFFNIVGGKK